MSRLLRSISSSLTTAGRSLPQSLCATKVQVPQFEQRRGGAKFYNKNKKDHLEKKALVWDAFQPCMPPWDKYEQLHNGQADLPLLSVGGTGSVFDTEIKRKTKIRDPNQPKELFKVEVLQWTDYRMLRDARRRILHTELNPTFRVLTCVRKCWHLPEELRNQAYIDLAVKIPRFAFRDKLQSRCQISSRGKGQCRPWRLSRIVFRKLADYNLLSGVKKSMWGP